MFIRNFLMSNTRILAIVWGLCVLVIVGFFLSNLMTARIFESNILALLPSDQYDPNRSEAISRFSYNMSSRVVFLVAAEDLKTAQSAAQQFYSELSSSGLFSEFNLRHSDQKQGLLSRQHYPFRYGLLTHQQREQLLSDNYNEIWTSLLRKISGPATASFSTQLVNDPLLLYPEFLLQTVRSKGELVDNMFVVNYEGRNYVLINGNLNFNPFSITQQKIFGDQVEDSATAVANTYPGIQVIRSGVVFHAISGTDRAMNDISTIGVGSIIGILVLILGTFRSLYPVGLSIVSIATGIIVGISACLLLFNEVHILTLVFGSSLIGVSIDYAFHYFADVRDLGHEAQTNIIGNILPGITLGMITSVIGYLMLILTDFPGLRQIAIFSASGLIASWLCVVLWFPLFKKISSSNKASLIVYSSKGLINLWDRPVWRKIFMVVLVLLIPVVSVGVIDIPFNDDIRILQEPSKLQQQQDHTIQRILSNQQKYIYVLVKGSSPQDLLQNEERFLPLLNQFIESGELSGFQAVSKIFPSIKSQIEARKLLIRAFDVDSSLNEYLSGIGLESSHFSGYLSALRDEPYQHLEISQLDQFESGKLLNFLWLGEIAGHYYSVILLENMKNTHQLMTMLESNNSVSLVDHASEISVIFSQYRIRAIQLIMVAYCLIFILLYFRYRLIKSLLIITPPVFASLAAISLAAFVSAPINIFHIFAVILILAIGIDYTLFFAERSTHRQTTMLAITLSAMTTILSFGLLALSDTKAINSFGLTLMIGIVISFLLSPIVGLKKEHERSD